MAIETKINVRYFSPANRNQRDYTAIDLHLARLACEGVNVRKVSGPHLVDGSDWGQIYYRIEYDN